MGFFGSITKAIGGAAKGLGKGVSEITKFGMGTARQGMQLPGQALSGNLKALGLSSNTLLMVGAGLAVLFIMQGGGQTPSVVVGRRR
jgi:hypothetical protein